MPNKTVVAACAAALALCCSSATASAAQASRASLIVLWQIAAPQTFDARTQAFQAGLTALNVLRPQLGKLGAHPNARLTFAMDPIFVESLERAATGESFLRSLTPNAIERSSQADRDALEISARVIPSNGFESSALAKAFVSHLVAANLAIAVNPKVRFSSQEELDFAGAAAVLSLASAGYGRDAEQLLKKTSFDARDIVSINSLFARACADTLNELKTAAGNGSLELAALPAYEPIVPLLIDSAGRSQQVPFTVAMGARTDATAAIQQGMAAVTRISGDQQPGLMSPDGAYDDAAASLIEEQHSAYAIFSDRVVKAGAAGSAQAVSDAKAAPFHSYVLATSRTNRLPIIFCNDDESSALDAMSTALPPATIAKRMGDIASSALAATAHDTTTVVLLCLDPEDVARRADRSEIFDHMLSELSGAASITATTPKEFLKAHPPSAQTYGFAPASDAGGFDLWMGSANQASMWNALVSARKAAGGDAALDSPSVRSALLRAEGAHWFSALGSPQERGNLERTLARFRDAIADIYRAAKRPAPASIAPVRWQEGRTDQTAVLHIFTGLVENTAAAYFG